MGSSGWACNPIHRELPNEEQNIYPEVRLVLTNWMYGYALY
jgi:hypothetical protein